MQRNELWLRPRQDPVIVRKEEARSVRWIYSRRMRARSVVLDALLAALLLGLVEAEAWTGALATHRQGPHWVQGLGYGIAAAVLVVRRRVPLATTLICCAALALEFVAVGSPEGFGVMVVPLVAAYTVANREDRGRALVGLAAVLALGVTWIAFDPVTTSWQQDLQGSAWLFPWVIAWLLGAYLRTRRLYVQGLVREREERALAAVADERNRIARELHDVIGHSVSVMTVQASAVRRLMRADQARERAALETVESTGRQALAEMRRMVGVLRDGGEAPNLAPPPSLDQLDRLAADFRQAGLVVDVERDGEPVPLAPGLDLTAYRLIQEGLTNTLRHAQASRAAIRIAYREDVLLVSVCDDGRGPGQAEPGNGLRGMRERVAVYGGTLTTGAGAAGGYELRAELPLVVG